MKKNLLLLFALTASYCAQAQDVLLNENCSTMTIGDVGTDITGVTPGQGNWLTLIGADGSTGSNSDFQVVDMGGAYGNAFQITGSNTATNTRNMWQDVSAAWNARTAGNDIAEVEIDFYTGPATTSTNNARIVLFDTDKGQFLGGFYIAMNTLVISGISYYDNAGTLGNYIFKLGAGGTDVVLATDTWYRLAFSFNYTSGEVLFKDASGLINGSVPGAAAGSDVAFVQYQIGAGTGNTVSAVVNWDNLNSRASATDTLLGTKQNTLAESKFSVSPNPATDIIRITNSENISVTGIAVTDLNGRVVKSTTYSDASNIQVNVSDLASGMYLMKITSDKGVATKKIIKN